MGDGTKNSKFGGVGGGGKIGQTFHGVGGGHFLEQHNQTFL